MTQTSLRDSLYLSDNPEETTFKYDPNLPSLPVPDIKQSVSKLLESIRPLAENEETFAVTQAKALEFIQDQNVLQLHELLKKRAEAHKNWLEDWWLEFAYLRSRKPLIPYSNMAAPLPIMKYWPLIKSTDLGYENLRARRAALSTYFQLCFWRMLREQKMRPMIHKGVPWSMNQFKYLFNTVRLPSEPKDQLISWFTTSDQGPPESTEVIVLHRGYVFAIQPVTMHGPRSASILSAPQIEKQLRYIEKWCQQRPLGPGVAALTTNERSDWAEARNELIAVSDRNRDLLKRIERALSVLVLDDNEPETSEVIFHHSMCGDPCNRWADKSITSIAFKNGAFGANADHTPYDGFCTGIMTHYLITSVEECGGAWSDPMGAASNSSWASYSEPELLDFKLNPQIEHLIEEAKNHSAKISATIDTLHETFQHYGKAILKEHRFHPEAFVQCAIHSAYFKMHGKMAPTYVTASTRKYHNGRTETCRSCYPEMRDLAKFQAENGANRPRESYELLRKSCNRFQGIMSDATDGQGCDRHLMGLYLTAMLEGREIPKLFDDELVQKTMNYVISSSCGGYWNVCGGVPPLVEDGYGCFYGIEDNAVTFAFTAYKPCPTTDLRAFYQTCEQVLLDFQKVMLSSKL